ncbi:MAG TPA: hypothetical protein PLJ35_15675, partial [Anaerolineae bacterium]|nr:hypothetical protein [Anaerolineae bacterium]HOR00250.1 hypothetical protein [Anaerolineae bacterium]
MQGIQHVIDDEAWKVELNLAPANVIAFWVVSNPALSVLNSTTRLVYWRNGCAIGARIVHIGTGAA